MSGPDPMEPPIADFFGDDPLGRTITLHGRTWIGHIVPGHPEMADRRADAESAILRPAEIHFSKSDNQCRLYYTPVLGDGLRIAVVADIVLGLVKTAYPVKRAKGGPKEWP